MKYSLSIAGKKFNVDVNLVDKGLAKVVVNGVPYDVAIEGSANSAPVAPAMPTARPMAATPAPAPKAEPKPSTPPAAAAAPKKAPSGSGTALVAPLPGVVTDIKVTVGAQVIEGETIAILEAMKMENDLFAEVSGTVSEILVQKGQQVSTGDVILMIS